MATIKFRQQHTDAALGNKPDKIAPTRTRKRIKPWRTNGMWKLTIEVMRICCGMPWDCVDLQDCDGICYISKICVKLGFLLRGDVPQTDGLWIAQLSCHTTEIRRDSESLARDVVVALEMSQQLPCLHFPPSSLWLSSLFLVVPCCCKERLNLSLCDVVRPVVHLWQAPHPLEMCFLGSSGNCEQLSFLDFFSPNFFFFFFFFTSKIFFSLSLFYAFLDVLCHPEWVKQGVTQCCQAF